MQEAIRVVRGNSELWQSQQLLLAFCAGAGPKCPELAFMQGLCQQAQEAIGGYCH